MFDIFSWQHIIILVVIALVVVGPKDLSRLMRMATKWVRKDKSVADGLRAEMIALKKKHPLSSLETAGASAPLLNTPQPRG